MKQTEAYSDVRRRTGAGLVEGDSSASIALMKLKKASDPVDRAWRRWWCKQSAW